MFQHIESALQPDGTTSRIFFRDGANRLEIRVASHTPIWFEGRVQAYWIDAHTDTNDGVPIPLTLAENLTNQNRKDWEQMALDDRTVDPDNPTEFWCRRCQRAVDLIKLVEVRAGFLEHAGHYID